MEIVSSVAVALGSLLLYSLSSIPAMGYYHLALVQIVISLVYLLLVFGITEAPIWVLWKKTDEEEALAILKRLYDPYYNKEAIQSAYDRIKSSLDDRNIGCCQKIKLVMCNSTILVPFILLMFLSAFQQLCGGQSVVPTYTSLIFKQAMAPNPNAASAYSVGVSLVVATTLTSVFIDKVWRKPLLCISAAGMLFATTAIGTSNYIISPFFKCPSYDATIDEYVYDSSCKYLFPLTAVSLAIFTLAFGIGVGPVPGLLFTEYIPKSVRGFTRVITIIIKSIAGFIIIGTFPSYVNIPYNYLAWWTIALINLLGLIFIVVFVKETKGKTHQEIKDSFCFGTGYSSECCKISNSRKT